MARTSRNRCIANPRLHHTASYIF